MGRIGGGGGLSNLIDGHGKEIRDLKGTSWLLSLNLPTHPAGLGISFVLVVAGEMDFKSIRK